ncbi:MAG: hypothetical protein AAGC93_25230 [Cyanobacteria bacterium P01_F01_bin.53]
MGANSGGKLFCIVSAGVRLRSPLGANISRCLSVVEGTTQPTSCPTLREGKANDYAQGSVSPKLT